MTSTVRVKSPGGSWLLGRGGAVLAVRPANRLVRVDGNVKIIGHDHVARHGERPHVEIPVVSDVIALALAQLIRDRWAAEKRENDDGRGRLRVMEQRQDP